MGFQSTPLADVFPCHLQVLLNISLHKEKKLIKTMQGALKGGRQMVRDVGDEEIFGLGWFSSLSCMFELLQFTFVFFLSQAQPFFRIRKVLFYGGKTSLSFLFL